MAPRPYNPDRDVVFNDTRKEKDPGTVRFLEFIKPHHSKYHATSRRGEAKAKLRKKLLAEFKTLYPGTEYYQMLNKDIDVWEVNSVPLSSEGAKQFSSAYFSLVTKTEKQKSRNESLDRSLSGVSGVSSNVGDDEEPSASDPASDPLDPLDPHGLVAAASDPKQKRLSSYFQKPSKEVDPMAEVADEVINDILSLDGSVSPPEENSIKHATKKQRADEFNVVDIPDTPPETVHLVRESSMPGPSDNTTDGTSNNKVTPEESKQTTSSKYVFVAEQSHTISTLGSLFMSQHGDEPISSEAVEQFLRVQKVSSSGNSETVQKFLRRQTHLAVLTGFPEVQAYLGLKMEFEKSNVDLDQFPFMKQQLDEKASPKTVQEFFRVGKEVEELAKQVPFKISASRTLELDTSGSTLLASDLALSVQKLEEKSELFPKLMLEDEEAGVFFSSLLPKVVLDRNYTHSLYACTLGKAHMGNKVLELAKLFLHNVRNFSSNEERKDLELTNFQTGLVQLVNERKRDVQFVLDAARYASSVTGKDEQALSFIRPMIQFVPKSEIVKLDRVLIRKDASSGTGGDEFRVVQHLQNIHGHIHYVLQAVLPDSERKMPGEKEALLQLLSLPEMELVQNKETKYEVVVISHNELFGKATVSSYENNDKVLSGGQGAAVKTSYPRHEWEEREQTQEEIAKDKSSKTSQRLNIHTYHHADFNGAMDGLTSYPFKYIPHPYDHTKEQASGDCDQRFTPLVSACFAQMLSDMHRQLLQYRNMIFDKFGIDPCSRNGWEKWPVVDKSHRLYGWQILILCLTTSSAPDNKCKEILQQILSRFPDPFGICENPVMAMNVLAARCSNWKATAPVKNPLSIGTNFGKSKFITAIILSKQVVIRFVAAHYPGFLELVRSTIKELDEKYCLPDSTDKSTDGTWRIPLPEKWVEFAEQKDSKLLPEEFDIDFFVGRDNETGFKVGLRGIGIKMGCLTAEAVYPTPYGPAVDRHLIRLLVECQIVPAYFNEKKIHDFCKSKYDSCPVVYTLMNEVPGMIGQIMQAEDHEGLKNELFRKLIGISIACGFGKLFPYYLRMYEQFTRPAKSEENEENDDEHSVVEIDD